MNGFEWLCLVLERDIFSSIYSCFLISPISFRVLAVLGSTRTVNEFLRRGRDFYSSAAAHLHSALVYAGSPRANPKPSKHPWTKLGAAWGSLVGMMFCGISCRLAFA